MKKTAPAPTVMLTKPTRTCPGCSSIYAADCTTNKLGGFMIKCPDCGNEGPVRLTPDLAAAAWNETADRRWKTGALGHLAMERRAARQRVLRP